MTKQGNTLTVSVIGTLPPLKGISPYCAEYALRLAEEAEVDFIGFKKLYPEKLYPGGTSCDDLYPVDLSHPNLEIRSMLTWYNPLSWIRAGMSVKGDVVHAQWWSYPLAPVFLTLLAIAKLRRKKVVMTVHNVHPHEGGRIKSMLNSAVFPLADQLLVHSEKNKRELAALGLSPRKIAVIPHHALRTGRMDACRAGVEREDARRELGISQDARVLCFFGNIRDYKGLDNLLLALDLVRKSIPDVRLIVAGQPWEPWERYEKIIREKRLEPNLITRTYFLPFRELAVLLKASDLAVFPFKELHSTSDSASLALTMGCNVMSTRHLDLPDGEGIFYVEDSHHETLAGGIIDYFLGRLDDLVYALDGLPEDGASTPGPMLASIYNP